MNPQSTHPGATLTKTAHAVSLADSALPTLDTEDFARKLLDLCDEAKGSEIVSLRVLELVQYTDWFVICSARSDRHARAIYEHLREHAGIKPLSVEGVDAAQWILVDYGHVVVHIFYEPVREFYALERLWTEAPRLAFEASPA